MRKRETERLMRKALLYEFEHDRLRQVLEIIAEKHPEIKEAKWALEKTIDAELERLDEVASNKRKPRVYRPGKAA